MAKASVVDDEDQEAKPEINWPLLLGFLVSLILCCMVVVKFYLSSRGSDDIKGCETNLAIIVTAAKAYAKDHKGHFPKALDELVANHYLEGLPSCPAAGRSTYGAYETLDRPATLTVACCGGFHAKYHHGLGSDQTFPITCWSGPIAAKHPDKK